MNRPIRWLARAWSLLSIGFVLLIVVGETLGDPVLPRGIEWLLLFFFPFGGLVGLILAWRREALGGAIALGSLFAFYVVEYAASGNLAGGPWFGLIAFPGLLFLLAGRGNYRSA